jgi:hypothetical protein
MALGSLLGSGLMGLGRGVVLWSIAAFADAFCLPFINGSNQAIWQSKVAPDVQGRVFAERRLIAQITAPVAMLLAGPLADRVFEPAMLPGGALAGPLGWLVGNAPGSGMSLILLATGLLGGAVGLVGYLIPKVRDVEILLPDHDAQRTAEAALAAAG